MSNIVMCSQIQTTVGILPGGKKEPPPKDNGWQSPKDPPNEKQPLKRSHKRARAWHAELSSQKPWSEANPSMPGELTFSQMLSNVDMSSDRMSKILIDLLSPLTPQQMEHESSRVLNDPTSLLRTESPLTQVYTEDIMSSRDWPEGINVLEERVILLDPQMALATIAELLNEICHQWLHYGPKVLRLGMPNSVLMDLVVFFLSSLILSD